MKNFTLSIAMLLITAVAIAQTPICPTSFRRNNGNGGNCTAKLTFTYSACPPAPGFIIDSIRINGVKANVTVGAGTCSNGKVEYCVTSGNLPTANSLEVFFSTPGVTGSNFGCFVSEGGTLPVLISSFFAKRTGNAVTINWASSTEINAKEYIVERNTGNGFMPVGTVAATNNGSGSTYSYVDNNNSKTITQYRLKIVDIDASFKLSETRAVKGTASVSDFSVYPNPSVGFAKITIADLAEATNVEVMDNAGRLVKSIELKTTNTVEINNLQSGIYLVRITNKVTGDATTKRLTVTN